MLTIHQSQARRRGRPGPVGLAIAGGGPLGAVYELGALRALDESIRGLRLHQLGVYVGVSSGAFIAAGLANGISTAEMCRIFMGHPDAEFRFEPERFLRPAYGEYLSRAARVPGILKDNLVQALRHPTRVRVSQWMGALSQAIPSGLFDNESVHGFLAKVLSGPGRTNDFRKLGCRLFVVAVDLDNGAAVRFGSDGHRDIPISRAVQASAALPGLYPPVEIDGRHFVDGALRRTLHASAALDEGVDLLLGINPLVPFDTGDGRGEVQVPVRRLIQGGLPMILSQTFRALIQSRMKVGFEKYRSSSQSADLLLLEPNQADDTIFFTNVFSFSSRAALCEHAYQFTRGELRKHRDELARVLARHGFELNEERLDQADRTLMSSLDEEPGSYARVSRRLGRALQDLEGLLDR